MFATHMLFACSEFTKHNSAMKLSTIRKATDVLFFARNIPERVVSSHQQYNIRV